MAWPAHRRPAADAPPLDARTLSSVIGARLAVRFQDLVFDCRVCNAKNSWGRVRLEVTPAAGSGFQWIELDRVVRVESPDAARALELL